MSITTPRVMASSTSLGNPAGAALTILARLAGISTRGPSNAVVLSGAGSILIGTAGTQLQAYIFRGADASGTQIATTGAIAATAGDVASFMLGTVDEPGDVAGQEYALIVQVTSATGASTIEDVLFTATY